MRKKILLNGWFWAALIFSAAIAYSQIPKGDDHGIKMKEIVKLLAVMNNQQSQDQMVQSLTDQFKEAMPKVPAAFWKQEEGALKGELPKLHEQIAEIYDHHFSVEELRGIIRFYKTPVGKRFNAELPQVTLESQQSSMKWGQEVANMIRADLGKEGYNP